MISIMSTSTESLPACCRVARDKFRAGGLRGQSRKTMSGASREQIINQVVPIYIVGSGVFWPSVFFCRDWSVVVFLCEAQ